MADQAPEWVEALSYILSARGEQQEREQKEREQKMGKGGGGKMGSKASVARRRGRR